MIQDTDSPSPRVPTFEYPEAALNEYSDRAAGLTEWTAEALDGRPGGLSPADCQLVAAFTSALNACDFCHKSHEFSAESLGVEPGFIERALADIDNAPCDDRTKALLRFVRKLNDSPARLVDSDRLAVLEAGWTDKQYFDMVDICGLFNYFNRLVEAYDIELPENFREMLHTHGH